MKSVLCITGMHRSGTSLTASWLEGCGIKLYEKEGPNVGNILGHFEDKEVLALHANSIKRINPESKGWIVSSSDELSFNDAEIRYAKQLIDIRSNSSWGWKEPRTTLYLETWKKLIPSLKVLLLWRTCDKVVDSLLRRSQNAKDVEVMILNKRQAVRNWIIYNKALVKYASKYSDDTIVINIDDLLNMDRHVFDLLKTRFNLDLSFVPIGKFYRKEMINQSDNLKFTTSRINRFVHGIKDIEEDLIQYSIKLK